ncbi:MAG: hypothetical protein FWH40_08860, partial [Coriobacteriia bacterium]|nr:hypothetical protein [Coriobacteriia bacterium]
SLEQQLQQSVGGEHVFDVFIAFLAQTAMSTTMFRDMYWPMVQAVIDLVLRYDGTIVLFMEGDNTRLWDFFKDIPRGHAALWLEQDDMFAAKQVLGGNLTLVGGYPVDLLANGSVQQCLDYAQRCVDELADDCGWIFTFDKGLSFKRDAKPENLAAVMQFMHEASI